MFYGINSKGDKYFCVFNWTERRNLLIIILIMYTYYSYIIHSLEEHLLLKIILKRYTDNGGYSQLFDNCKGDIVDSEYFLEFLNGRVVIPWNIRKVFQVMETWQYPPLQLSRDITMTSAVAHVFTFIWFLQNRRFEPS